ncbi:MAG: alpha/beta hydrolase, partial [Pseudomonadota bacterium]
EMNRSRDALRAFGQAAADRNASTLIPDLRGTGDSPGAFGEFSIGDWCDDLRATIEDARARFGDIPVVLLGIRFGALLAARVAPESGVRDLLLWQPATEGKRLMREFLRVWSAANMGAGADARATLAETGELEVAGYRVTQTLVGDIDGLTFALTEDKTRIHWLEAGASVSARSERGIQQLRSAGHDIRTASVDCPPFWRVQERVNADALVAASLAAEAASPTHG